MPLFDFHCRSCGNDFEALVMPRSTPSCPACHSGDLEKLHSSFAVSSAERTKSAAEISRKKAAKSAGRDRIALEREGEHHRKEEH